MKNNLKSLVESLLSENQDVIGITGVQSPNTVFTQREVPAPEETVEEKTGEEFVVEVDGKVVWEGLAKDSKEAIKKAGDENEEALEGKVRAYKKTKVNEESDITLSPKSFRTLYNCFIAEQMVNETVEIDEALGTHGLIVEGKITPKGVLELKKYLPTIFSS